MLNCLTDQKPLTVRVKAPFGFFDQRCTSFGRERDHSRDINYFLYTTTYCVQAVRLDRITYILFGDANTNLCRVIFDVWIYPLDTRDQPSQQILKFFKQWWLVTLKSY